MHINIKHMHYHDIITSSECQNNPSLGRDPLVILNLKWQDIRSFTFIMQWDLLLYGKTSIDICAWTLL